MKRLYPILTLFVCLFVFIANAQKLPSTQENSLKAPANVKVDGRITEWGERFQAYNRATSVYYSVANNHDALYLLVQATDAQTIKKIIGGGITFTIMAGSQPAAVTFPLLSTGVKGSIGIQFNNRIDIISKDSLTRARQTDSLLLVLNNSIGNSIKDIRLAGMKNQTDSLISVYNNDGFKVALRFDKQFALNYELAIPLTSLGLTPESAVAFNYKIAINSISFTDTSVHRTLPDGRQVTIFSIPMSIYAPGNGPVAPDSMNSTTYCKGTYTLAK